MLRRNVQYNMNIGSTIHNKLEWIGSLPICCYAKYGTVTSTLVSSREITKLCWTLLGVKEILKHCLPGLWSLFSFFYIFFCRINLGFSGWLIVKYCISTRQGQNFFVKFIQKSRINGLSSAWYLNHTSYTWMSSAVWVLFVPFIQEKAHCEGVTGLEPPSLFPHRRLGWMTH